MINDQRSIDLKLSLGQDEFHEMSITTAVTSRVLSL